MENKKIILIDETLREGMQYRGIMFSLAQRKNILEFQETLKVDICQAGYPPAHALEADTIKTLFEHARTNHYAIRVAAMGRAVINDAKILLATGINDLHFHVHVKPGTPLDQLDTLLENLLGTMKFIKEENRRAVLSVAMLDIGKSNDGILENCVSFLNRHHIDIVSLPDTSGMMAPNQVFEKIQSLSSIAGQTKISIHCHNDMGMATANSVMGILAGGSILEASVLGIGERNGIADLYTAAKTLQNLGFDINLKTDDTHTFKAYYEYVDAIVHEQTGKHLLTFNTPFFGEGVKTHVAGTHAGGEYGQAKEERFFLNILCGHGLVKKYLGLNKIPYNETDIKNITLQIKAKSFALGRCLSKDEVAAIAGSFI